MSGSFFGELRDRRVFQIFGIYLGAGWAMIQFVDWLVNRYYFSPHLTDLVLTLLLSLIPAILMLAYFHGRPGADSWTRWEKIGIPLNVLFAAGLVFFLFGDKTLGSSVKTVMAKNEDGKEVVRTVPKQDFLKKIVFFYLEPNSDNPEVVWQARAFPLIASLDLGQDSFFKIMTPYAFSPIDFTSTIHQSIKEAGYGEGIGVPLALQAKLTRESHFPYFLRGSFDKQADTYQVDYQIHSSKNQKRKWMGSVTGSSYLELIDNFSMALKKDLDLPTVHIEETGDLPIGELLTNKPEALKAYVDGYRLIQEADQLSAATEFEKAVKIDPSMAHAYIMLQAAYLATNQAEKRAGIVKPLMKNLYKLPDRDQYFIKADNYMTRQEGEKAFALVEMITELYPEDLTGWGLKAFYQTMRNEVDGAIESYNQMLVLDPMAYETYLTIGNLYQGAGNFEKAEEYYNRYNKAVPNMTNGFQALGNLFLKKGSYERANAYFEKVLLLEPDNIEILLKTSEVAVKAGRFDRALDILEQAMVTAEKPEDRYAIYRSMLRFYRMRGQMTLAVKYMELLEAEAFKFQQPFMALLGKMNSLDIYVEAGQLGKAEAVYAELQEKLKAPFDRYLSLGAMELHGATKDVEALKVALQETDELIKAYGNEFLRVGYYEGNGIYYEIQNDYENALAQYQEQQKAAPSNFNVFHKIGRCYRELGQLDKAEKAINKCLNVLPFSPKAHYEMALLQHKKGKGNLAKTHLDKALEIWKDADPEFEPAAKAKAKKESWQELF